MTTNQNSQTLHLKPLRELSQSLLESMGWKKAGAAVVPGHQIIAATYIKGDDKITYDGTDWVLNGVQKITNQSQVPNNET